MPKAHTKQTKLPFVDTQWKVHTPNLLQEIVDCTGQAILEKPLSILGQLLANVGERAAELNDPQLNALMCRLTIYSIADPKSPDYDPDRVRSLYQDESRAIKARQQSRASNPKAEKKKARAANNELEKDPATANLLHRFTVTT